MTPIVAASMTLSACLLGIVAFRWIRAPREAPPPEHRWNGDRITPAAVGPRSSAPERVALGAVLTQAVLLAIEMARADDEVDPTEVAAIEDFIRHHVPEADARLAEKVLRDGLATRPTPATVAQGIETLRAFASPDQRRLVVGLFVHVARADGRVDRRELAFMERVAAAMGFTAEDVRDMVVDAS